MGTHVRQCAPAKNEVPGLSEKRDESEIVSTPDSRGQQQCNRSTQRLTSRRCNGLFQRLYNWLGLKRLSVAVPLVYVLVELGYGLVGLNKRPFQRCGNSRVLETMLVQARHYKMAGWHSMGTDESRFG